MSVLILLLQTEGQVLYQDMYTSMKTSTLYGFITNLSIEHLAQQYM